MDGYGPNYCAYDNCGKRFDNIRDLILHIEALHIEFDVDYDDIRDHVDSDEDFPTRGIPMSRILQYGTDDEIAATRVAEENAENEQNDTLETSAESIYDPDTSTSDIVASRSSSAERLVPEITARNTSHGRSSKACWFGPEMSPEAMRRKAPAAVGKQQALKTIKPKKYACPVRGCTKSYKNLNGMKYHVVNFHDMNGNIAKQPKVRKEFKCDYCSKEYKTFRGLQGHIQAHQQQPAAPFRASPRPRRQTTPRVLQSRHYYAQHSPPSQHRLSGSAGYDHAQAQQAYAEYTQYYRRVRLMKQIYGSAGESASYYINAPSPPPAVASTSAPATPSSHYRGSPFDVSMSQIRRHPYHPDIHTVHQRRISTHTTASASSSSGTMYEDYYQVNSRTVSDISGWTYEHTEHTRTVKMTNGRQYGGHGARDPNDYASMSMQLEQLQTHMLHQQMTRTRTRTIQYDTDDDDVIEVHNMHNSPQTCD